MRLAIGENNEIKLDLLGSEEVRRGKPPTLELSKAITDNFAPVYLNGDLIMWMLN